MKTDVEFDYMALLANSIHEVKNSLNMLLNSIEEVIPDESEHDCRACQALPKIQYESRRVNDSLVELLAVYRIRNNLYSANIEEHPVADFLLENIDTHEVMLKNRKIEYQIDCDDDLYWFFDRDLLTGVISNVINNLYKYTKDSLQIVAREEDGYLVINISDNGPGYPEEMLIARQENKQSISFESANTGLGLYFSGLVAELHTNKGRHGFIATSNQGIEGGGCFSIYLP